MYYMSMVRSFTGEMEVRSSVIEKELPKDRLALPAGHYEVRFTYSSDMDRELTVEDGTGNMLCSIGLAAGEERTPVVAFDNPADNARILFSVSSLDTGTFTCHDVVLYSEREVYHDSVCKALLLFCLFAAAVVFVNTPVFLKAGLYQKCLWGILGVAFLIQSLPCWGFYVRRGHDLGFHWTRIEGMTEAMAEGQFPASIYPYCYKGFGMLGRIYPQCFLYPITFLRSHHVSVVGCYQLLLIFIGIASAAGMYYGVRSVTKNDTDATVSAILFLLFPYRMADVLLRSAIGEVIALLFFPVVIAGFYHLMHSDDDRKGILPLVIGFTGIICSHILSCVMVSMFSAFLLLTYINRFTLKKIKKLAVVALLTLLLNAMNLIPILTYMKAGLSVAAAKDTFQAYGGKLWHTLSKIGSTSSLGPVSIPLFLLLFAAAFFYLRKKDSPETGLMLRLFVIGILTVVLNMKWMPWELLERIPLIRELNGYFQFPSRYLAVCTVCLTFGAPIALRAVFGGEKKKIGNGIVLGCILFALICGVTYVSTFFTDIGEDDYTRIYGRFYDVPEYMPRDCSDACIRNDQLFTSNPNINVTLYEKRGTHILCQFYVTEDYNHIDFPLFYYPGYQATYYVPSNMAGVKLPVTRGDEGRIRVVFPKSNEIGALEICYTGPWTFKLGYVISLLTLAASIAYFVWQYRRSKRGADPE